MLTKAHDLCVNTRADSIGPHAEKTCRSSADVVVGAIEPIQSARVGVVCTVLPLECGDGPLPSCGVLRSSGVYEMSW